MPDFNYLEHNKSDFPHIDNIDVYKYDNNIDYERYNAPQLELLLCTVPWDVGEAHVGQRTISGIGNVVYFETPEARDAWFAAIPDDECYRFTTKYKELHRDLFIDVPIPFDMCARHNYLVVEYHLFANDGSPVEYEGPGGVRKWFWFVREVEFIAPNTTRLHLLDDAFQTWIYDVDIEGMILERGHAPMFKTKAENYLAYPAKRCGDLLAPDVENENATKSVAAQAEYIFNAGDMKAVIISSANPQATIWGSKATGNWKVPAGHQYMTQGVPSYCAFCIDAGKLSNFIENMHANVPQFAQTIKAVCFVSTDMISLGYAFEFCGIACNMVNSSYKNHVVMTLDKDCFGYPDKYSDIAKLYTYPYSHIEITDGNGDITEIRIERTSGKIGFDACVNFVYPFLKINAHMTSVRKIDRRRVHFSNVSNRSIDIAGSWYEYLMEWDIPTFGIVQDPGKYNDYSTYYDRQQQVIDYTNTYDSHVASANTAQTNTGNEASNVVNNAAANVTSNNSTTTRNKSSIQLMRLNQREYNNANAIASNAYISTTATSTISATEQQAAVSATAGAITSAASAVGSAASRDVGGTISNIVGGVAGYVSTMMSANISANMTAANANAAMDQNDAMWRASQDKDSGDGNEQQNLAQDINTYHNTLITTTAANTAATMNTNAANSRNTEVANAGRTRNTAINAIDNQIAQASIAAPQEFGSFGYGDSATTRPMGLFANVVTMDDYSIEHVGDEFLRYGYMYNKQWAFDGNWNIGECFTYWKLSDFWVRGLNVPDLYMDKLRFFLFGGVTIWRKPEYIGNVTIYDNGI